VRGILVALMMACAAAPAAAQVASRAPEWARPLLVVDTTAVNVRQSVLAAPEGGVAVRLSVAPAQGGVARLMRFESSPAGGALTLWRFTGHVRNGWVLWGAEQAIPVPLTPAQRTQIDRLARAALAAGTLAGESAAAGAGACANGNLAWAEVSDPTRSAVFERRCAMDGASGALIRALVDLAGNKDEEALYQAGIQEVLDADRAFAQLSREQGVGAAMVAFAAEDGRVFQAGAPAAQGKDSIAALFQGADPHSLLSWQPEGADVSARGDMAFSWGRWTLIQPGVDPRSGAYVSVWKRDPEGAWRFSVNIGN